MDEKELNPADLSVAIGFPCGADVPWQTALSLARTTHACALRGIQCQVDVIAGSSVVTVSRSAVLDRFLKGKFSRLFWIDSDIVWSPEDFLRLLMLSAELDVVGAVYPLKTERKTIVIKHPDLLNFDINKYGCIKVEGMGLGFTVMTREVVEKVAATKPRVYNQVSGLEMADVFRLDTSIDAEGKRVHMGEDMAFFKDIRELGYDVWLDPTIQLGHVGPYVYRADPVAELGLQHVYQAAPLHK